MPNPAELTRNSVRCKQMCCWRMPHDQEASPKATYSAFVKWMGSLMNWILRSDRGKKTSGSECKHLIFRRLEVTHIVDYVESPILLRNPHLNLHRRGRTVPARAACCSQAAEMRMPLASALRLPFVNHDPFAHDSPCQDRVHDHPL